MSDLGEEIDDYLDVFFSGSERGDAPVSTRTSERDLNVPVPTLPGYLANLAPAVRTVAPTGQVRSRSGLVAASRTVAPPPLMFTTPAAKAAGGSPPPPSPVMSASPPSPPDAPPPPPPDAPVTNRIVTNYASAPPPVTTNCPPCSCPGGISTSSILALIAAAGVGWYLLTDRSK